jgi:hypothetical protein
MTIAHLRLHRIDRTHDVWQVTHSAHDVPTSRTIARGHESSGLLDAAHRSSCSEVAVQYWRMPIVGWVGWAAEVQDEHGRTLGADAGVARDVDALLRAVARMVRAVA